MSHIDNRSRRDDHQGYDGDMLPSDLDRMTHLDYEIAEGETDIRGYDVYGRDREKIGTVEDLIASPSAERAYFALVNAGNWLQSRRFLLPLWHAGFNELEKRVYVPLTQDEIRAVPEYDVSSRDFSRYNSYWGALDAGAGATGQLHEGKREIRVPEVEETAQVRKVARETGHVTLRKRVETETRRVSVPVTRTRVVAERRDVAPGEEYKIAPNATTLREGEEIRVPVVEEEAVVEKVPRVTGEVVLRTEKETKPVEQDVELRRERVEVDEDVEEVETVNDRPSRRV